MLVVIAVYILANLIKKRSIDNGYTFPRQVVEVNSIDG